MNEQKIKLLKPLVAEMARKLVQVMKEKHGVDLLITSTYRSFTEQDEIYAQGRTKPGSIVTQAKGGQSFHNYGVAFDCVPLIGGKPNWSSTYATTALEASIIGLEHGDRGYTDLPHFQCRFGHSLEDFQHGKVDWSKYEISSLVESLKTNQNKHMDVTNETPQILKIKKVTVMYDKYAEGELVQADMVAEDATLTPELLAGIKSSIVEEGWNITVEA